MPDQFPAGTGAGGRARLLTTVNGTRGSTYDYGDTLGVSTDSLIPLSEAGASITWTPDGGSPTVADTITAASGDDAISVAIGSVTANLTKAAVPEPSGDVMHILWQTDASNGVGGATSPSLTEADTDPTDTVMEFSLQTGNIQSFTTAGQSRIGGFVAQTGSALHCALAWKNSGDLPAGHKILVVKAGLGGVGGVGGGGVFNPYTSATPWTIGDPTPTGAGEVFEGIPGIWAAVKAAVAAAGYTLGSVKAMIKVVNENDAGGAGATPSDVTFAELIQTQIDGITGIRTALEDPTIPVVMYGGVPEDVYDGSNSRRMINAVHRHAAELLPYCAFIEGPVGYQDPFEDIHFTSPGLRVIGPMVYDAFAVAESRTTAPGIPLVDALDGTGVTKAWGTYRMLSAYADGPALRISNGLTEIDVPFLNSGPLAGMLDWNTAIAHALANTGDAWVVGRYDHGGSGMSPQEEVGTATLVKGGYPILQGTRSAYGDDENDVRYSDSYTPVAAGCHLAIGRLADGGNKTIFSGPADTIGLVSTSGELRARVGTDSLTASAFPEAEPAWAVKGKNLHGYMVTAGPALYIDGELDAHILAGSVNYISVGYEFGGKDDGTRNSVSNWVADAVWSVAPTGATLAAINSTVSEFVAEDDMALAA